MQKIELEILKTINGLDLPRAMSDKQLADYNNELDDFIDTLSSHSYEWTKVFVVRDYVILRKKLIDMAIVLKRIYAADAVEKCNRLADTISEQNKDKIDKLLGKFIAGLNTLSIDIQLSQYKSNEQRKQSSAQATQTRKNILAVDDDPVILNDLKGVIDCEKYKFIGVTSGKEALRYLDTYTPPDLFIVDIEMPEMNGYELTESIVAKGHGIPIIFLTSNATREAVMTALQAGATDFLVKPINEELILNRLEQYLG